MMLLYLLNKEQNQKKLDFINSKHSGHTNSDNLIKIALLEYNKIKNLGLQDEEIQNIQIARGSHGKPYFKDEANQSFCGKRMPHFSISHSGDWWACILSDEKVGFDIEDMNKRRQDQPERYIAIADRFFTEEEKQYVIDNGIDGFFDIWVRKEAYIKYKGTGISEVLNSFSVLKNNRLSNIVEGCGSYLSGIKMEHNIKGAYSTAEMRPIDQILELKI